MNDNTTMTAPTSAPRRLLPISQAAARLGVTMRALRHYETLGLVIPTRPDGHARAYDEVALQRLELVVTLRAADLPLRAVAEILDAWSDTGAQQHRTVALIEAALDRARQTVNRLEAAGQAARRDGVAGLKRLATRDEPARA